MIDNEYERWEQKKRDVMYHIATGDTRAAQRRLDALIEHTFTHWREIREAAGQPVCPEETGQVVHKTLK